VIRIEYAARLIIQAYELGLEGRLKELDPCQRIAALVDLDLAKAPPKLKEIEEKERKKDLRFRPMRPPALTRSVSNSASIAQSGRAHIKLDRSSAWSTSLAILRAIEQAVSGSTGAGSWAKLYSANNSSVKPTSIENSACQAKKSGRKMGQQC
jgi:hypothetical protein